MNKKKKTLVDKILLNFDNACYCSYDYSTLNRPMASQGSTRYEDRTMQRTNMNSNNIGRSAAYQPVSN